VVALSGLKVDLEFASGILGVLHVTICLEGLADVAAFYWFTSMVENNP
jgi:hypothetical protein